MLDIRYIRANPNKVKLSQRNRNKDENVVYELIEADKQRRKLQQKLDAIKAQKNQATKDLAEVGDKQELINAMQSVSKEEEKWDTQLKAVNIRYEKLLLSIPNIPAENVPVGKSEADNVSVKTWGDKPEFEFKPLPHEKLGEQLDLIDSESAAISSGSRFSYLKNELVLMQWGLMTIGLRLLTSETELNKVAVFANEDFNTKPFVPVLPPDMLRNDVYRRIGRLFDANEDDIYKIEGEDLRLAGSAEHTLLPLHLDKTFDEKVLPVRYVGFSTAFRREAGTYGKDTKGILRQHQFDKLEMLSFSTATQALKEHNLFIAIQEYLMQQLKLPYEVSAICTGDMGPTNVTQIDINGWLPSQDKYRETHTADYNGDYQARGMNTKVKLANGGKEFVHTNDATVFARRPLIAILENYQQADGSVKVPEILVPYVGKEFIKSER